MMNSKPSTPPIMMSAATRTNAASLVRKPPCHPNLVKTVAVASTASEARTVSQPTSSSQEMPDGTRLPLTPNAARLKVIVGACPRLPDKETRPHSRNEMTDRKSTRLNSSHGYISYAVFCLKKKKNNKKNE